MSHRVRVALCVALMVAGVLLSGTVQPAVAEVPLVMNCQGVLTNSGGEPITTSVSVTFTIYDDSTGGNPKWTEMQTVAPDAEGRFNVLLGSATTPLADTVFSDPERYLGIAVAGEPELTPRSRLISVPYAFVAGAVSGRMDDLSGNRDSCYLRAGPGGPALSLLSTEGGYQRSSIGIRCEDSSGQIQMVTDPPEGEYIDTLIFCVGKGAVNYEDAISGAGLHLIHHGDDDGEIRAGVNDTAAALSLVSDGRDVNENDSVYIVAGSKGPEVDATSGARLHLIHHGDNDGEIGAEVSDSGATLSLIDIGADEFYDDAKIAAGPDGAALFLRSEDGAGNGGDVIVATDPSGASEMSLIASYTTPKIDSAKLHAGGDRASLTLAAQNEGGGVGGMRIEAITDGHTVDENDSICHGGVWISHNDDAGNRDSSMLTAGPGGAALSLVSHDEGAVDGDYITLLARGEHGSAMIMGPHYIDTTIFCSGITGNAFFAGTIKSGNSLIVDGPLDRLLTTSGEMYLGRDPATGSFDNVAVGVGTQTPQATLHVDGTTRLGGVTTMESDAYLRSGVAGGARILGEQGNTPARPAIGFFSTDGVNDGGGGLGIYRPAANEMAFATSSTERMRLYGGNLGIGISLPRSRLHVNGPIATAVTMATGNITFDNTISVVLGNNSGGPITVTLPSASSCPGRQLTVKKISSLGDGAVTVDADGGDLIEGFATYPLTTQNDFVVLVSYGANWYVVGR